MASTPVNLDITDLLATSVRLVWVQGTAAFSIASLFSASQAGAWYEASDISTLFQDAAGTTAVTVDGDPVGLMLDQSGNAVDASQSTSAARPVYKVTPDRLLLDKVDDLLTITVPTGGWTGTMVLATDQGAASYGVSIPAGAYELGGQYFPGTAIVGALFRNGALTAGEKSDAESYFVGNGATTSYSEVSSFSSFWERRSEITEFPFIDTSNGTSMFRAWLLCSSLTSFPLIDTSKVTDFVYAWYSCSGLLSFPLIDTSAGTSFFECWVSCRSLTSFPPLNMDRGTNFDNAWINCEALASFPANAFDNVPTGKFTGTFSNTALNEDSIDGILVSLVTSGIATGTRVFDQSGGSAPSVGTGQPAIDTLRSRGWAVTVTGGY